MTETVFEREFLYKSTPVPLPGFKEKSVNRLVNLSQPPSVLNIEVNHLKRNFSKKSQDIVPLLEYQLWLEAGKLDKANLRSTNADTNVNINSNLWRNFCASVGIQPTGTSHQPLTSRDKSPRRPRVTDAVATLYPINIPMPSRLGSNTLSKYYEQNKRDLFANDKSFGVARERVEKEDARMRFLRLKSEMRNPPVDWQGNILPPSSFKKYPNSSAVSRKTATSELSIPNFTLTTSAKAGRDTNTAASEATSDRNNNLSDYASILSVKRRPPVVKKIIYRQNHPDFSKVVKEQQLKNTFKISANMS